MGYGQRIVGRGCWNSFSRPYMILLAVKSPIGCIEQRWFFLVTHSQAYTIMRKLKSALSKFDVKWQNNLHWGGIQFNANSKYLILFALDSCGLWFNRFTVSDYEILITNDSQTGSVTVLMRPLSWRCVNACGSIFDVCQILYSCPTIEPSLCHFLLSLKVPHIHFHDGNFLTPRWHL